MKKGWLYGKPVPLILIGFLILLLSACGTEDAAPVTDDLNVTEKKGQWVVESSDKDAAQLWLSQNPLGDTVSVQFADYDEPVDLVLQEGQAFLGDMVIGDVQGEQIIGAQGEVIANVDGSPLLGTQSFGIRSSGNRWPNAVVPYVYDSSATQNIRNQFEAARRIYQNETGIRLVPRTNQAQYVRVQAGGGCSSYVGQMSTNFKPNGQELKLGRDGCGVGAALHEIGHAVGLEHEQNRCDRDQHINIRFQYIDPDWHSQYRKNCSSSRTAHSAYDYQSIMHYRNARQNGQWRMLASNNQIAPQEIGRNGGRLTASDKRAFAAIYGNSGGGGGGSEEATACFFTDINYGGRKVCVKGTGNVNYIGNEWNDKLSSVQVTPGYTVTMYFDRDLGGGGYYTSGNQADFRSFNFNDELSSVKVSRK